MSSWLARLKNEKTPSPHATKPTKPPQGDVKPGFVGFVAYPRAPFQKCEAAIPAPIAPQTTNADPAPGAWEWPHSDAWNKREIDTFLARLARFTEKGVLYDDAERLADSLVARDREDDDRRLCLECTRLQGTGHWRCGRWQGANVPGAGLAPELVTLLQRCDGFDALRLA